ncbi:MAG TPA: DUF6445 family protein, partial [Lysobacter sp.]|nr:DUF6445 family protein [Lysobacter sp.]
CHVIDDALLEPQRWVDYATAHVREFEDSPHDAYPGPELPLAARHGVQPGYMTASNARFEKLLAVKPRWNRLIFYSGMVFHTADITQPERLGADPRTGRLTLNGFFTCRRNLA